MSMGQKEYRIRPPELCPFMQRNDSIGGRRMGHKRRVVSCPSGAEASSSYPEDVEIVVTLYSDSVLGGAN